MYGPHNRARLPISARGQQLNRENELFAVLARAGEFGLARRVRQSHLASACSSPYSRLNLVLAYEIPPEFRGGVHSLSVHIMYYECSSACMYSSTY